MVNQETVSQSSNRKPVRLGIWGLPNSGKTVYMTMLYHYLSLGRSQWQIATDDLDTEDFVNDNRSLMLDHGEFVPNTLIRETFKVYSYKLVNKKTKNVIELRFFDLPGECYLDLLKQEISTGTEDLLLINYLNQCHGILFLLSPLEEDFESFKAQKGSYFTLLSKLFQSMQRCRKNSIENELEPYVVFCITKIDDPKVYKKSMGIKAEESLLKLLGKTIELGWLTNFLYAEIDKKTNSLNPHPSQHNRCQVMYISCFGVDGHGNSPVYKPESNNEKKDEKKDEKTNTSPNVDTIFSNDDFSESNSSENDPYENDYDEDDSPNEPNYELYKIDTTRKFYPINMLSPIEWIIKGIEQYYPQVSSPQTEEKT